MNAETRANIKRHGVSVLLRRVAGAHAAVLKRDTRPLLQNGDPEGVMRRLMEARYPVYRDPTSSSKAGTCRTRSS